MSKNIKCEEHDWWQIGKNLYQCYHCDEFKQLERIFDDGIESVVKDIERIIDETK